MLVELKIGQKAPDFTLTDQDMAEHSLSDYRGRFVVLYFYPKDDTPGCTTEACNFRDAWVDFHARDVVILGVSVDSVASHRKFLNKYALPFFLLADTTKKVVNKYGVWQQKKLWGHEYMGTVRTTFLIDPKGKIAKIYEKVNPLTHTHDVLEDIKQLSS